MRREKKFKLLIQNSNEVPKSAEINIINFTKNNKKIPENIKKVLSLGLKNAIGGTPFKNDILNHTDALYTKWLKYAHDLKIDYFRIAEVRSLIFLEMQNLNKCITPSTAAKDLKTYLNQNKEIIILQIDKSKNLGIVDIEDYIFKLNQVFSPDKFEKLSKNPLQSDILKFHKVIYKLKPYLSISDNYLIQPTESIKKGYGILKIKKPGMPLRPIVSSIFSITSGAEQYLLKILKPLVEKCKFSLSSTKVFKEKFMKITQNFTNFYEIFNIDATSLYTSINVPRVIDHIVSEIYTDPDSYLNDNN